MNAITTETTSRRLSGRGRQEDGAPNKIDIHVGARVRLRRTLLGMSQEKLGESLGLSFQQVQKYERGANRIGASRLYDLARVLDVPVSFFYDDMPDDVAQSGPAALAAGTAPISTEMPSDAANPMTKRETLELVRAYYHIQDDAARQRLFALVKAMAGAPDTTGAEV